MADRDAMRRYVESIVPQVLGGPLDGMEARLLAPAGKRPLIVSAISVGGVAVFHGYVRDHLGGYVYLGVVRG